MKPLLFHPSVGKIKQIMKYLIIKKITTKNISNFTYLFTLIAMISLAACSEAELESDMKPYEGPVVKAFNIFTVYSDSGDVKITVEAPLQLEYENGDQDFPKGVLLNFFNSEGENYNRLTSNRAKYFRRENKYVAYGNVIVKNIKNNERLNTEELTWTPNDKTIFTDKFVTITTPEEILKGQGMTANQDFTTYKITKPTGQFKVDQSKE